MPRYQNRLNRIFAAGIVWDPAEPLPEELRQDRIFRPGGNGRDVLNGRRVDDPFNRLNQLPIDHPGHQAAATWPVGGPKVNNLPHFTVQEQGRNVLPPLSVTVDASIVQDTARVTVTQLFWNDSGVPIKEAAFTFPLATGCTVTDFSCRIGTSKVIKGAVKPKEEAREAFRNHIRDRETAAGLLEQDTPEIFTTTLGNVPEKTKVKVELTYITVLKHVFAGSSTTIISLTLPTSIAPRYGDVPEEYNDAATTNVPQGLTLEVEIVESERIISIVSTTHAITVTRRRGARSAQSFADLAGEGDHSNVETASVTLESGRLFLEKDFVLDIMTTPDDNWNDENPQAWLEEHPTIPDHKTLMLTLPYGFLARNAPPMQRSEILFLADCSGSMWDKIKPLRSAMQFFLKGIPEGRKFNIWRFGTNHAAWQPRSVDYTKEALDSALSWVQTTMNSDMGGTELLPAVQAIVAAREKALMTDVIVLTDGQTWRLEQTLDFIQKTRGLTEGRVRFFALGIGKAVSHSLVDGIAKAGGGYAEVVQEASQGGWEDRVVSMAKAALTSAHLGPLHLAFDIQDETGNMRSSTLADAKRSPADTSALNPFDRSRIYFHLDCLKNCESIKSVRVEVQADHDTKTLNIPVIILDKRDTTLHKLAARAMLDDLERGRSHIHLGSNRAPEGSWEETIMVRKEAEKMACKWSLVSKWTSFFLAEERYTPTGNDASMEDVLEIRPSPGDDLLQPRKTVQHVATLEPADLGAFAWGPHNLEEDDYFKKDNSLWLAPRLADVEWGEKYSGTPPPVPPHLGSGNRKVRANTIWERLREAQTAGAQPGASGEADPSHHTENPQASIGERPASLGGLQSYQSHEEHSLQSHSLGYSATETSSQHIPSGYRFDFLDNGSSSGSGNGTEVGPEVTIATPTESSIPDQHPTPAHPGRDGGWNSPSDAIPPNLIHVGAADSDACEFSFTAAPLPSGYPTDTIYEIVSPTVIFHKGHPSSTISYDESDPAPGDQRNSPERDFVSSLLNFQHYDGSVDFGSWEVAEMLLGKAIADALRSLQQTGPGLSDRGLWTAAVHVLLERNFQSCKALWELMAIKTASYCRNNSGSSLLEVVGKGLEGLKLPLHQQQEERTVDVVPEIVTVEPLADSPILEKESIDHSKRDRKKPEGEKQRQGTKEADSKARSQSGLLARIFGSLKARRGEGLRLSTKSRTESSTVDT
ncbi:von Willebrand factor type A domain-containing protein [Chaetomium sp. MPI-CAGE-AT-0009]|nr:von Willebrand factor type A domain-containing protein [Chaetomium sp. MPI-CAGE-AT-0009]